MKKQSSGVQPSQPEGSVRSGVELIAEERKRQIEKEKWGPRHDENHKEGELIGAAACYTVNALNKSGHKARVQIHLDDESNFLVNSGDRGDRQLRKAGWYDAWPWEQSWDKRNKHDKQRSLVIAGALIAAELDRLNGTEAAPPSPKAVQSKEEGEQLFRSVKAAKRKPPPQKILFFRIKGKKYLGYMYHSGEFACSDEGDWTCIFKNIEDIEWLEEYAAQTASPVSTQTDAVAFMKWAFENKDYQWTGESWDEDTGHDFFNELSHAELYEIFKEQSPISNSVSTQVQGVSEEELNQLSNKWAVDNADETFATNSALNKGFKAGFKAVFSKK